MTDTTIIDVIKQRREALYVIRDELKTEFFGLDAIIDRVIDSVSTWYLLPQALSYPVIINLWGLTGVGKTALVRSLVKKLQFQDKFVEIQMDGFSIGSGFYQDSICSILQASAINEGEPGILLLDEFQRFRTIELDSKGDSKELDVKRFQDVWMLLSDGKFSTDYSLYSKIERELTQSMYDEDWKQASDEAASDDDELGESSGAETSSSAKEEGKAPKRRKKKKKIIIRKFKLSPWEAVDYKKLLKLKEPVPEIMTWDLQKINFLCHEALKSRISNEIDFSKLLIFVCGNLDEAYRMVGGIEDCDTDADVFHDLTKKISVIDIKAALLERFRKEQIARLGNNHIIYPSLAKRSYELIIESTAKKYTAKLLQNIGVEFDLKPSVYQEIYNNSVFPAQGTRPVFSSIHQILSSPLVDLAIWAVENNQYGISVTIDDDKSILTGSYVFEGIEVFHNLPIQLDIRAQRLRNTIDFNTLVAVHEAGHGMVFAVLNNCPPAEIKINLATFKGGYTSYDEEEATNKQAFLNRIAIALGGRVAEELVFGQINSTTGAWRDIKAATEFASRYYKQMAFSSVTAQVRHPQNDEWAPSNYKEFDKKIHRLVEKQKQLARDTILRNSELFKIIVNELLQHRAIKATDFMILSKPYLPNLKPSIEAMISPYSNLWKEFNATVQNTRQ